MSISEQVISLNLPVGISNFREVVEYKNPLGKGFLFVDKSLFIKEIIYDTSKTIVFTRPRRFGKTLNLSMLYNFFSGEVYGRPTKHLFKNLKISQDADCFSRQGQHPVIFITLKDVRYADMASCVDKFKLIISEVYKEFIPALQLDQPNNRDQQYIESIINRTASNADLEYALFKLSKILYEYYGQKPMLLIDEYDTPIQQSYLIGYYDQLILFMKNFLGSSLKDNPFIEKSVLTGILRISRESLFSGLNNVSVYSVLDKKYGQYFGFTEQETNELIEKTGLSPNLQQTKNWYNGYNFGGVTIYNPWSIIEFLRNEGRLTAYWINTSSNDIVKNLITNAHYNIQEDLQQLLAGRTIKKIISDHIVFNDLTTNREVIWGLLLMAGYLKHISVEYDELGHKLCELKLPNREVENFYGSTVAQWLAINQDLGWYREFLADLTTGRVAAFEEKLQTLIEESLSFHDVTKKSQEAFYHGLMLGLVVGLRDPHIINSNKESGQGRYDVAIIPKDNSQLGIILEFKAVQLSSTVEARETQLATAAQQALQQINQSKYVTDLHNHGVGNICAMGVAFSSKVVKVIAADSDIY
jgi:hypothetical protein